MFATFFAWRTIIRWCWPGVFKLHSSEVSGVGGAGMPKFLKKLLYPAGWLTNSLKFTPSSLSLDNSATKEETCRG